MITASKITAFRTEAQTGLYVCPYLLKFVNLVTAAARTTADCCQVTEWTDARYRPRAHQCQVLALFHTMLCMLEPRANALCYVCSIIERAQVSSNVEIPVAIPSISVCTLKGALAQQ